MIFYSRLYRCLPKVHLPCLCRCHRQSSGVRVRFAPSPTGQLHLGGLRTALYNYLFARSQGGTFILRIEDTDQSRSVPGAVEKLVEMLKWSQITIDEGSGFGGRYGPYFQSERLDLYKDMSRKLLQNGTAYRCFCSQRRLDMIRKDALRRQEIPKYDNRCRHLSESEVEEKLSSKIPFTIRFKLEPYTQPWEDLVYGPIVTDVASIEGDPILMKTDGFPTYHFANVVDDHFMEISHVLRGMEWQVSTTKHILLYKAFGWQPPKFAHLPLLLNKDGKKLSKRQGDVDVEHFKNLGYYPGAILNLLTDIGSGFKVKDTAGMNMADLIQNFDLDLMNVHLTRVDFDKLGELNRRHLGHKISDSCQVEQLEKQLAAMVMEKYETELAQNPLKEEVLAGSHIRTILNWSKNRIHKLDDLLNTNCQYLWLPPTADKIIPFVSDGSLGFAEDLLNTLVSSLSKRDHEDFEQESLKILLKSVSKEKGLKLGSSMKVFRAALCAQKEGPSVAEMIHTLGRQGTIRRLEYASEALKNR